MTNGVSLSKKNGSYLKIRQGVWFLFWSLVLIDFSERLWWFLFFFWPRGCRAKNPGSYKKWVYTLFLKSCFAQINTLYHQSFCKESYLQIENTDFCLILQQVFSHICLAKLVLSCCFARAAFARRPKGAKQQERINFAKQICNKVVEGRPKFCR